VLEPLLYEEILNDLRIKRMVQEGLSGSFFEETLSDILRAVEQGEIYVWSWGDGVLTTQVKQRLQGRELFVHSLAGEKLVRKRALVEQDLLTLAREFNCRWIGAMTLRHGMEKLMKSAEGYSALYLVRELKDG
jgi:hypothetical protein